MHLVLDPPPMKGIPGPGNLYLPTCPPASFQVLPQKSRVWCWWMCDELVPSSLPRLHPAFSVCFALSSDLNVKHLVPKLAALSGKVVNPLGHLASLEEVGCWEWPWDCKNQFHFLLTLFSDCWCSVTVWPATPCSSSLIVPSTMDCVLRNHEPKQTLNCFFVKYLVIVARKIMTIPPSFFIFLEESFKMPGGQNFPSKCVTDPWRTAALYKRDGSPVELAERPAGSFHGEQDIE